MQRLRILTMALLLTLFAQCFVAIGISSAASGPVLVSTLPVVNSKVVPVNAQFKMVFSEAVQWGANGSIAIKDALTNNTAVVVTGNQVAISQNVATFTPAPNALQPNQDYYVQISPGTFTGQSGGFDGISDAASWNFRTVGPDQDALNYSISPTPNSSTMAGTGSIDLTFNKTVYAISGNIQITRKDTSDTQVISVLSPAVTGSGTNVIRIQPTTRLASSAPYELTIDGGAFGDQVGNKSTPTANYPFSTAASAVAAPQFIYPAKGGSGVDSNVPISLKLQFAGNMAKGTAGQRIYVKKLANNETVFNILVNDVQVAGNTVTIPLPGILTANTSYYVLIDSGAFTDAGGNAYEGIVEASTWGFSTTTTVDTTPPVVTAFTPAANSTTNALNGALTIQFNEPVRLGSGTIVIRNAASQGIVCSIPVTSASVVGGGSATITITPCTSFASNTSYSVQIGSQAFTDLSGNAYAGIPSNDFSTWRFTVSQDTTPPELVATAPVSGANSVKTNATLTMTFSEPVKIRNTTITGTAIFQGTGGTNVSLKLASTSDPRVISLTPVPVAPATTASFAGASKYVVNVPANAITDLADNPFPGILNEYRWSFATIGTDTTPPLFTSAAIDGSAIVLTYNEDLDETSIPFASNYYVTVNDVPRQVNGVEVKGKLVRLTLQSGIAVGQTVKVSYTVGSQPLRDLSGNAAVALGAQLVSNTYDTTLPKPMSGSLTGNTLTLTFNKQLTSISPYAASQFTVKSNGAAQSIASITSSGANVIITLYSNSVNTQSVSVSYAPGSYKLVDLSGNEVAAFNDFYILNTTDTTPPQLSGATVVGNTITLTYNEGLLATSIPLKSSFSVLVTGSSALVTGVAISNNIVTLTLGQSVPVGQTVLVTYISGTPAIKDLAGNTAPSFSGYSVLGSTSTAAKLSTITATGNTVVLAYTSGLNNANLPFNSQYLVKADGSAITVSSVAVSGTQVTLTLSTPIKAGQKITVTYYSVGIPLKDALGQAVEVFSDSAATNQASGISGLPDYLTSDGTGGLLLAVKASSPITSSTSTGQAANRYMIDGDKLLASYTALKTAIGSNGVSLPQITFRVPQTEAGAMVGIPIRSLTTAASLNGKATFRLDYGDYLFDLPLNAVNYNRELQANGGDISSAYLLIGIEKSPGAPVSTFLSGKGAQSLATPANFTTSLLSGGKEKVIEDFDVYVTRSFVLSSLSYPAAEVSVVRLDTEAGGLSYVPTKVDNSGGGVKVNFMRKSNSVYALVRKQTQVYNDMAKHWASGDVAQLAAKFIVDGPTTLTFDPEKKITRGEFAEFIARGLGLTGSTSAAAKFSDVGVNGKNAAYIGAVSKANIVLGGSDGKYRPNANITREEMATIMLRAMNYVGTQPTTTGTELTPFADRAKVSVWAKDAVLASIKAGLMNGVTTKMFKPQDSATRAQAAVIVKRFLEYVALL